MRTLVALLLISLSSSAGEPIPPSLVTIEDHPRSIAETMAFLHKQCGLTVDASKVASPKKLLMAREAPQPFWHALEKIAASAECHVELSRQGQVVSLLPGNANSTPSIDGPFRIIAKSIIAKADLATGRVSYDVALEIAWEQRMPVFRIDSQPAITGAADDRGVKLTATTSPAKSAIGDVSLFTATVSLNGLTRDSKSIKSLEGKFTVTAAPKMLSVEFADLAKLPAEKKESEVTVALAKFAAAGDRWDAVLHLDYPAGHPEFESFESWTDNNKLKLFSPDRTKSYVPESFNTSVRGRRVVAEYHFTKLPPLGDRKGWTLVYDTPAPLTEFEVKFAMKDIPLP